MVACDGARHDGDLTGLLRPFRVESRHSADGGNGWKADPSVHRFPWGLAAPQIVGLICCMDARLFSLSLVLLASSSVAAADGWSGPGYYIWAPSSTDWDSTKVLWSDRYESYEKCQPDAEQLNQQLDSDRASQAMFLFECHKIDTEIRTVTASEIAAVVRDLKKQ